MTPWFIKTPDVILTLDTVRLYDRDLDLPPTVLLLAADFPTHTMVFNIYRPSGGTVESWITEYQAALHAGLLDTIVTDVLALKPCIAFSEALSIIQKQAPIRVLAASGFYCFLESLLRSTFGCDIMQALQLKDEDILDITELSLAYVAGVNPGRYPHCRALHADLHDPARPVTVGGYNLRLMAERFGIAVNNFNNCIVRAATARAVLARLQKGFKSYVSDTDGDSSSA